MKSYQAPASPFDDWNANEAVDPEVFRTKNGGMKRKTKD